MQMPWREKNRLDSTITKPVLVLSEEIGVKTHQRRCQIQRLPHLVSGRQKFSRERKRRRTLINASASECGSAHDHHTSVKDVEGQHDVKMDTSDEAKKDMEERRLYDTVQVYTEAADEPKQSDRGDEKGGAGVDVTGRGAPTDDKADKSDKIEAERDNGGDDVSIGVANDVEDEIDNEVTKGSEKEGEYGVFDGVVQSG